MGVKFSVHPSVSKQQRVFTPRVNEGVNITPRGQIFPLGVKFTPWVPGVKLRMAPCKFGRGSRCDCETVIQNMYM
jgi:hypothetical protein